MLFGGGASLELSNSKGFGFTLAEVLITLGIIGVVAAITMPTLISKYQKKVLATQLKKNFSAIEQAIIMTQAEIEDPNWVHDIDEIQIGYGAKKIIQETAEKYIIPNLQIAKNYGYIFPGSKIYNFPKYKNYSGEQVAPTSTTGSMFYTFEMVSGAYVFYTTGRNSNKTFTNPYIYVDVNGQRPPNIIGKDVFLLIINFNGHLEMPGIRKTRAALLEQCNTDVNKINIWGSCGALIQKDGWQFSKDYPW